LIKALKYEEVDGRTDHEMRHARAEIGTFIEQIYDRRRLHSALGLSTAGQVRGKPACRAGLLRSSQAWQGSIRPVPKPACAMR
jgi:hypothetical protein